MIKILLFAGLAEKAGTSTLEIDMEQATTDDVKAVLKEQYGLESIDTAMIAVNESYVKENTSVSSGDTVAVIPPVSGDENRTAIKPSGFCVRSHISRFLHILLLILHTMIFCKHLFYIVPPYKVRDHLHH